MGNAPCDFYDWTNHRRCDAPARWVTHQSSQFASREQYYCDTHRPPRAHLVKAPPAREIRPGKAR